VVQTGVSSLQGSQSWNKQEPTTFQLEDLLEFGQGLFGARCIDVSTTDLFLNFCGNNLNRGFDSTFVILVNVLSLTALKVVSSKN
jgi:hypothetical protein